jgi:hypothetical protein
MESECFFVESIELVHRKEHLLGVALDSHIKSIEELVRESFWTFLLNLLIVIQSARLTLTGSGQHRPYSN